MGSSLPRPGPGSGPRKPVSAAPPGGCGAGPFNIQASGVRPELLGLAEAFVDEPELVLACLQGIERKPPGYARRVLRAVQLALSEEPHYADLYCYGAHAALAAGDDSTAAKLLEQALALNPTYTAALVLAGRVALARQQPQQARALLQSALAQGADFPDVHMLLAQAWQEEQNWPCARAAYERVLALNENLTAARDALAALPLAPPNGSSHELPA